MKKFITALLCALVPALTLFTACGEKSGAVSVYVPDGAPALAIARLLAEDADFGREVNYSVVGAEEIKSTVTAVDETKNADICILPVNTASKLLGKGDKYRMLGVATHGNLFIAGSGEKENITPENFKELLEGKKVGVVNLPAFPGSAFKLILNKYGIADGVPLENCAVTAVSGVSSDFDYFVLPEPALSVRTGNPANSLKTLGSLQSLYGENGYPQAVLVAKKSLIEKDAEFVRAFMDSMEENAEWLMREDVTAETIISAIAEHYPGQNTGTAFNSKNLNKTVIANCAVRFEDSKASSEAVKKILAELRTAGDASATEVSESFFYFAE